MTAEPKVALDSPVESEVLSDPEAQQDAVTASIGFSKYFEVDFSILLGIFMHLALRKPHVWIKPTAYQERKRSEELVALCHSVQDLDVFVSHCWKAPELAKQRVNLFESSRFTKACILGARRWVN